MNAREIKQALTTRDSKSLVKVLNDFRVSLSAHPGETISPNDPRLLLAEQWLGISPAAHDLFDIWTAGKSLADGTKIVTLVADILSSLLSLFSAHLPHHPHGISIINVILSPQWLRQVNSYLGGTNHDRTLASLRLFYAMSMFGSGRMRKAVLEAFPWDNKTLSKLLYMRRKGKDRQSEDFFAQPDIRTQYVLFILSILDRNASSVLKAAFLDQHGDAFTSIFKGLHQDHDALIRRVLQICWEGIWSDPKIRRTAKVASFSEVTISHLLKLYDRTTIEMQGSEHAPADIVHHFLLAICTHPGQGICFRDRGWYHRDTDESEVSHEDAVDKGRHTSKIYNKILANVLRTLQVNEDPRQQDLALKILAACPELVAGYWSNSALALEPRCSSKWIINIMFVGQIISQAVPASSFLLPGSLELYNPTPPSLSTTMANVFPPAGSKALFTKGVQATSAIVQYCSALVLAKCLRKLTEVVRAFNIVEVTLEEDDECLWYSRRKEIEIEARRYVPDFQVIIAFWQQASASHASPTTAALLSESSQRLLSLYQESLPDVVAEAKFEVGKLLNLMEGPQQLTNQPEEGLIQGASALRNVVQLHVLRFLQRSRQFNCTGKLSTSSRSYIHVLLTAFCNVRIRALRDTLGVLLQQVLSESLLFQEDPGEVEIWLAALPCSNDGPSDSVDVTVSFLDECFQRCLKTPYRYIEAMMDLARSHTLFASPLLMTAVEQSLAKASGGWLAPSDVLFVYTFLRRLLVMLASKQEEPEYNGLHAILDQLDNVSFDKELLLTRPNFNLELRHELLVARRSLRHLKEEIPLPLAGGADNSDPIVFPPESAFDWLYLQTDQLQLQDRKVRDALLKAIYSRPVTCTSLDRSMRLVTHGIAVSLGRHPLTAALLTLLSGLLVEAKKHVNNKDMQRLKKALAIRPIIHTLWVSDDLASEAHEAMQNLILSSFDPTDHEDQKILSPTISHWKERMMGSLIPHQLEKLKYTLPWVDFMGPEESIAVVDFIATYQSSYTPPKILEEILTSLAKKLKLDFASHTSVSRILKLKLFLPSSSILQDMLSVALAAQLRFGFESRTTLMLFDQQSLSTVVSRTPSAHSFSTDLLSQFLWMESWTHSTAKVITALLYAEPTSVQIYSGWLNSGSWKSHAVHLFVPTLLAFLETTQLSGGHLAELSNGTIDDLMSSLSPAKQNSGHSYTQQAECICMLVELANSRRPRLVRALEENIKSLPVTDLVPETTLLAEKILRIPDCDSLSTHIVDSALQWTVRVFSDGATDSNDARNVLNRLKRISGHQTVQRSSWIEPLLTAVSRNCLTNPEAIELATLLAEGTQLKSVVINRLIQNILQNSQLPTIFSKDSSAILKDHVTFLLDILFRRYPTNTCQPSHIEQLLPIYGGTMSLSDRRLLSIMRLFEAEKRCSLSPFLARWSPVVGVTVTHPLEAVQNLDPTQMLRTCLSFPNWRRFGEETRTNHDPIDVSVYDPLIIIILSAQMLVDDPPVTAVSWVKVFRSNVVCLLIRCLSSKDSNIREAALCQIARLWESIQRSDVEEKTQVVYILRLLKNTMHRSTTAGDPPRRLPTFTSLILLHALRGIFYPSNFIYPHTARFLLQRPELDISDVPMLFGMLYSSSDDWKKERGWILRMLSDGMVSTDDWRVLKRRHTWDLMASLFEGSKNDTNLRTGILGMLANLTCHAEACTSLILKSSLLSWIEMHVDSDPGKESITWLRILENIVVTVDASKVNRAMGGEWCSTICRILSTILQGKDKGFVILCQSGIVLLRLSLIEGIPNHSLRSTLSGAVEYLLCLEPSVDIQQFRPLERSIAALALPPHRAHGLQEIPSIEDPVSAWGTTVEMLWRVGMSLEDRTHAWTMLTRRLLVWRALVGDEMCPLGEWVRKEVVRIG